MTTRTPAFSRVLYMVPTVDQEGNEININGNVAAVNTSIRCLVSKVLPKVLTT